MPKYPFTTLRLGALVTACAAYAACAVPPAQRLALADARAELAARGADGALAEVLAQVPLGATALSLPPLAECTRPERRGYWLARAVAHSPAARAALGAWRALRAEVGSAGAPAPLGLQVTDHQFGGDDELVEAVFVFDVLGHLGLGPSGTARARASAAEGAALGALELALWDACLRVERARLGCAAARARRSVLAELTRDARQDLERVAILARHGRVGEAASAAARAAVANVALRESRAHEAALRARADLGRAAGLTADDAALDAVDASALDAGLALAGTLSEAAPTPGELDAHPRLRAARLRFASAEAEVRDVAAQAWPSIGLGPHFGFSDELRVGGMLQLGLPFPSHWRGRLNAAVERRAAAVDAFEDELLALETAERDALARLGEVRARQAGAAVEVERASAEAWASARASYRVGRSDLGLWVDALRMRSEAITLHVDEAEALALAALDVLEARGPAAASFADGEARP